MLIFIIIFISLFTIEVFYLKYYVLKRNQDRQNNSNSSVSVTTIIGGGIIFFPAIFLFILFFYKQIDYSLSCFISATLIVAVVSFIDDLKRVSPAIRIVFQFIATTIALFGFECFDNISLPIVLVVFCTYLFIIGYTNIYNFMDGINGMTFLNSLCSYITLYFINTNIVLFTNSNLITVFILATLVFGYFNFRKRAKCFVGDVGSITIGFTITFFTLKLFMTTKNPLVFLILVVYSLDGGWTILERFYKKENIFKGHLRHLYELCANEIKIPHLIISIIYFVIQTIINVLVYYLIKNNYKSTISFIIFSVFLSLVYFVVKKKTYKRIKHNNEAN